MIFKFVVFRSVSLGMFLAVFLVNQTTVSIAVLWSEKLSCGDHYIPLPLQKLTMCSRTVKYTFLRIFRQNIKLIYHCRTIFSVLSLIEKYVFLKKYKIMKIWENPWIIFLGKRCKMWSFYLHLPERWGRGDPFFHALSH